MNRKSLWHLFRLLRPLNIGFGSLSLVTGMLHARAVSAPESITGFWLRMFGGALSYMLIAGYANLANDIQDVDTDRINHPARPLPTGAISVALARRAATWMTLAAAAVALATIAFSANPMLLAGIAFVLTTAGAFYARHGKRIGYLGNLLVGLAFAAGFPVGFLLALPWRLLTGQIGLFSLSACCLLVGREIVKDMQDRKGDRLVASRSLPLRFGPVACCRIALLHVCAAAVCLTLAMPPGSLQPLTLTLLVAGLGYLLLAMVCLLPRAPCEPRLDQASRYLKLAAYFELMAFVGVNL